PAPIAAAWTTTDTARAETRPDMRATSCNAGAARDAASIRDRGPPRRVPRRRRPRRARNVVGVPRATSPSSRRHAARGAGVARREIPRGASLAFSSADAGGPMRRTTTTASWIASTLFATTVAFADEAPPKSDSAKEVERLGVQSSDAANPYVQPGEIVVTAKGGGVPLAFPHQRDVVDKDTLQTFPQGAVTETLRAVPGVFIQSDAGNDVKMSIGIRGQQARVSSFTGILVDGIPVKQTLYGVVDLDIFPFTFERAWKVDVIEGGADLRYGPNAYGGVINFITAPIPKTAMARLRGAYGSDGEYSALTEAGGTWGKFGALVTGVKKGGDGWRENSEYRQEDFSAKFAFQFDDANRLTGSINRFVEDVELASGLTQAQFDADPKQAR